MWAAQMSARRPGTLPSVIKIVIRRDDLTGLESLAFVRGDFHAEDYWSLVHYCRKSALNRARLSGYYDVIYGPVAAFWNQRMAIANVDQISFYTSAAEAVSNATRTTRAIR